MPCPTCRSSAISAGRCGLAARDPYGEIVRYLPTHRDEVEPPSPPYAISTASTSRARAKAPALFSVALMDDICPPSTVYAAYNAYGGAEGDRDYPFNNHEGGGPFQERRQVEWLAGVGV